MMGNGAGQTTRRGGNLSESAGKAKCACNLSLRKAADRSRQHLIELENIMTIHDVPGRTVRV